MGKTVKMSFEGNNLQEIGNGLKIYDFIKKLDPRGQFAPTLGQYTCACILQIYSKFFFSETIKAKLYMKNLQEEGINVLIKKSR